VLIEGAGGTLELAIGGDEISAGWREFNWRLLEEVRVELRGDVLTVALRDERSTRRIASPEDAVSVSLGALQGLLLHALGGVGGTSRGLETMLVDGRAGIERVLLTAYPGVGLIVREILAPDFQFVDSVYRLAREYVEGRVNLGAPALRLLLEELGLRLDVREEFGVPRIYVETWTGRRLPLERAPSGVREVMPAVLALASERAGVVYIEEPEAHLHPRAVRLVARLMAYALNRLGKKLRITTHSDVLVAQLNNLIAMSAAPEAAERLGYDPSELIRPGLVRAYWLRRADGHAEVRELPVEEDGFDESTFEKVAKELFEERGEVLSLIEAEDPEGDRPR